MAICFLFSIYMTIGFPFRYILYRTFFKIVLSFTLNFVLQIYKQKMVLCNTNYYIFYNYFSMRNLIV